MQISKGEIVDVLRAQGEHDKALNVASSLPEYVDTELDAGLLAQYDLSVRDLAREVGHTEPTA